MRETPFKKELKAELARLFPGCIILPGDPNHTQGIPDLIMLWGRTWAALEVKASPTAALQPNQGWYIDLLNEMCFAAFINPANKSEVLSALQESLKPRRPARVSVSEQLPLGQLRSGKADTNVCQQPGHSARHKTARTRS